MVTADFYERLGARISEARRAKKGLTQERLATVIGLSRPSMVNIERGRQPLKVHQLVALADALGLAVAELLPGQAIGEQPPPPEIQVKLVGLDDAGRGWVQRVITKGTGLPERELG